MTFYVSTWTASEHPAHPGLTLFTPTALAKSTYDQSAGWSAIDLRPDESAVAGYAIVWTAFALPSIPAGTWLLAAGPDSALTTAVRNRIGSLLGVTIPSGTTFRQAVRQLMTVEAKGPANGRWRAVLPTAGQFAIALGDLDDMWASG